MKTFSNNINIRKVFRLRLVKEVQKYIVYMVWKKSIELMPDNWILHNAPKYRFLQFLSFKTAQRKFVEENHRKQEEFIRLFYVFGFFF